MPTNRDLLMNQRKKQKGLPISTNKVITEPRRDFSAKVDISKRESTAAFNRADRGLATKGIKDVDSAISREFSGLSPDVPVEADKTTNTLNGKPITGDHVDMFQGKPIPENVGMPGNVTIMPKGVTRPTPGRMSNFGLPTDRLPSFSELGGAIGQMFKFVGGLTKKRQALGLIPGRVTNPSAAKGLSLTAKDRATILAKQLDDLTLTPVERNRIKSELDKIMNPASAEERTDIDAILNE